MSDTESMKTRRVIYTEWVSTIAVFLSCFGFLTYKIEKQDNRTDRLYEMFIDLLKEKK